MVFYPDYIETPRELRTRTANQEDLVFLSGFGAFRFNKGLEDTVVTDELYIPVGPIWRQIDPNNVVASVALATIEVQKYYDIPYYALQKTQRGITFSNPFPINLLWGVDNCRVQILDNHILLQRTVAVKDAFVSLLRVAYHVDAIGTLT